MATVSPQDAMQIALAHHQAGRLQPAEAIYRQVLAQVPNHPEALHLLGIVALQVGQLNPAIELFQRAISANPSDARFHASFGRALAGLGRFADAAIAYRVSLSLDPNVVDVWYNLGNACQKSGSHDEAITAFQEAIARKPDHADAWNNLGTALQARGSLDESIDAFRRATETQPDMAEAYNNLGNVLRDRGSLDSAVEACTRAITLQPNFSEAHNNLGAALLQQLKLDPAISSFQRSLELNPEFAHAHLNLGLALLLQGDLPNGFSHYEWRWKIGPLAEYLQDVKQPKWDGEQFEGKRLLVHAEQGFGDTIQFVRYLPQVAERGGAVILVCPPHLQRLLKGVAGVESLTPHGQPLPEFDLHCPLLSLPHILGTTVETIPAPVPYLKADAELSARWRQRLPEDRKKGGLVWAGRASNRNDRNRSLNLEMLSSLTGVEDISFFSLQKYSGEKPSTPSAAFQGRLTDWAGELEDFADTAALLDNLDLLITVDTATAHLAGAMGKPVWVLLPFFPDWRWMLDRNDSPWYPTMRLFRQPSIGDWDSPIRQVVRELSCLK